MPMFHFNSVTGDMLLPDPEGEELPDLAAARRVAEVTAKEALIEALKTGDAPPDTIQITDSEGRELGTIPLQDLAQAGPRRAD